MSKRRTLPKAQRRAIANKNLAKARRLRWKGHHKKIKRKLSKAQRRKIAMQNMRKAWAANPKHGHKRGLSPKARKWISSKVRYLVKKERRSKKQAAAIAYSMARKRGFKIPR